MINDEKYNIVLDDDPFVEKVLFRATGIRSMSFSTLSDLKKQASELAPLAVFIDIHLQTHESGLDVIPDLKRIWPECPFIVVTSSDSDEAIKLALEAGANDFIRKPLNTVEIKSRLQARLFDSNERAKKNTITYEDFSLDVQNNILRCGEKIRHLSQRDSAMIALLVASDGTVISRELLSQKIWGKIAISDNSIDRKIYDVRVALKDVGSRVQIKSFYGEGVSLDMAKQNFTEKKYKEKTMLNTETLERLRSLADPSDSVDFLTDLIDTFSSTLPNLLSELKQNIKNGDSNGVEKVSHRIKGTARELGATKLTDFCANLEKMGHEKNLGKANGEFENLLKESEIVLRELRSHWRKEN